ncbi:hypothetical protein BpHYR1_007440, partial [Brachionus plicatilis]
SFDDLLTYAIDKFNGFDTNLETESDSAITNTKIVRFENSVAGENQQAMQKIWNNRLSLNGSNFQQNRHRYDTRYQARQTQLNNNPQDVNQSVSKNASDLNLLSNENNNGLIGKAIFNNTLVSCYFDTGASCTVINESVYVRIKTEDPKTLLEPYTGKPIWSCNKKLTVYGQVRLRNCQVTGDSLENVIIIITNHKSRYECLLGVDLMKKTPFFDKTISIMENDIKSYSDKMTRLHENMSKNFEFKKPNRRSV